MTTDVERREATDQWIIQTREQQLRDIRAQLAAVTAERDAAVAALRLTAGSEPGKGTGVWVPLDKWTEIQARLTLVDTFAQWKRNAPKGSLTFAEWLARRNDMLQPRE